MLQAVCKSAGCSSTIVRVTVAEILREKLSNGDAAHVHGSFSVRGMYRTIDANPQPCQNPKRGEGLIKTFK